MNQHRHKMWVKILLIIIVITNGIVSVISIIIAVAGFNFSLSLWYNRNVTYKIYVTKCLPWYTVTDMYSATKIAHLNAQKTILLVAEAEGINSVWLDFEPKSRKPPQEWTLFMYQTDHWATSPSLHLICLNNLLTP